MLTPHGWKSRLSPRRGFTVLQARVDHSPPVVLALHDSQQALGLFRSAIEEAKSRSLRLVVLDFGDVSLHDLLWDGSDDADARERQALRALWSNPHVRVVRAAAGAGVREAVDYCESNQASLLIVAADVVASVATDHELGPRIFNAEFDLLVMTEQRGPARPERIDDTDGDLSQPPATKSET
jgi:hypothetical protein